METEVGLEGLQQKNLHQGKAVGNIPSDDTLLKADMRADQISGTDAKHGFWRDELSHCWLGTNIYLTPSAPIGEPKGAQPRFTQLSTFQRSKDSSCRHIHTPRSSRSMSDLSEQRKQSDKG